MKEQDETKWVIHNSAPYIRPQTPFSVKKLTEKDPAEVVGVRSDVYDWIKKIKIGHVFFMDIDEQIDLDAHLHELGNMIEEFGMSSLIIYQTQNGYHLICPDIRKYKANWFEPFMAFKDKFDSDYEYGHNWILRLSNKGKSAPPFFADVIYNPHEINTNISSAHLTIYKELAGLPVQVSRLLYITENKISTYAGLVKYKTWNYFM